MGLFARPPALQKNHRKPTSSPSGYHWLVVVGLPSPSRLVRKVAVALGYSCFAGPFRGKVSYQYRRKTPLSQPVGSLSIPPAQWAGKPTTLHGNSQLTKLLVEQGKSDEDDIEAVH